MNPPFPKKKTDRKEYLFIEQALKQMQHEGVLFSVLPYSCMIKEGSYLVWRQNLLKENTLLSVVTFPSELFVPIGVRTVGVFIRKGMPQKDQKVLWIRALHDGFRLIKGRRFHHKDEKDDIEKAKPVLKGFLENPNISVENIPEFQKSASIDYNDPILELCPEAYLDEIPPSTDDIKKGVEETVRDTVAFLIRSMREEVLE